ncbi:MarP family serine protease [Corynebacterium sp. 335C]
MTPTVILDLVLVAIALMAMWSGWKQGIASSLMSFVGVVAGGIVGYFLAPPTMDLVDQPILRLFVGVATIVVLIVIGQAVGGMAGQSLRNAIRSPMGVGLDSGLGSVFQALMPLIVVWIIAMPLAAAVPGQIGATIRGSKVLGTVDALAPSELTRVPGLLVRRLDETGIPQVISPFEQERRVEDTTAADPSLVDAAMVDRIRPSVVQVIGEAQRCERLQQGSGFVVAPDTVVTNAHVVAGADTVRLDTVAGTVDAEVVHFDPGEDVAILRSPGLPLPALEFAPEPAYPGDGGVVLGFPGAGPYTSVPARVENRVMLRGFDIYSQSSVDREVYVLRADVRQGNSGGPFVDTGGRLLGLVFGAGVGVDLTGYALTLEELRGHLDAAAQTGGAAVGTGECVVR